MSAALDEDQGHPPAEGEWADFWPAMRHLYSRTSVYLATGVRTGDIRAFRVGRLLWIEVEEGLSRAHHRLGLSGHKSM